VAVQDPEFLGTLRVGQQPRLVLSLASGLVGSGRRDPQLW